eukprot:c7526_g1_i2.p1 GENE.c7526_g1_i2~~c7526_g1_i2.p1  ORF type:complete len:224 (+),score=57.41 c7526_g1_i2:619-1290(+)
MNITEPSNNSDGPPRLSISLAAVCLTLIAMLIALFTCLTVGLLLQFTLRIASFNMTTMEFMRYGDPEDIHSDDDEEGILVNEGHGGKDTVLMSHRGSLRRRTRTSQLEALGIPIDKSMFARARNIRVMLGLSVWTWCLPLSINRTQSQYMMGYNLDQIESVYNSNNSLTNKNSNDQVDQHNNESNNNNGNQTEVNDTASDAPFVTNPTRPQLPPELDFTSVDL